MSKSKDHSAGNLRVVHAQSQVVFSVDHSQDARKQGLLREWVGACVEGVWTALRHQKTLRSYNFVCMVALDGPH